MQSFIYQDLNSAELAAGKFSIPADIFIATNLELVGEDKPALSVAGVRELIKKASFMPFDEKKTIIIPNADKMLIPAQNALLKTLEEPPAHTIFMLICENPQAMLDTILSRCEIVYSASAKGNFEADKEYIKVLKPILDDNHTVAQEYQAIVFLQEKSKEKDYVLNQLENIFGVSKYQARLGEAKKRLKFNSNWNITMKYIVQG